MAKLLFAQVVQLFRGKKDTVEVETRPLVLCEECKYSVKHCCDSVFGKPLYVCKHPRQIGREGEAVHVSDWFCADGEEREKE